MFENIINIPVHNNFKVSIYLYSVDILSVDICYLYDWNLRELV